MIHFFRRLVPRPLISLYHLTLAVLADFFYRSPSDQLIIIGVTGTSGKSTVIYLITKILEQAGYKVGVASTILFKVGRKEWLNDKKMTMIGRFSLQKLIRRMVRANCQYALIETTSEGIKQHRHWGINYDLIVFTNLYPEHIEAHGSFENYKKTKLKLFAKLKTERPKMLAGQRIKKTMVVNLDDPAANDFLDHWAEEKFVFTTTNKSTVEIPIIRAEEIAVSGSGSGFSIDHVSFRLNLPGRHNVANALAAITVGVTQGLALATMAQRLEQIPGIPGRLEFIDTGQKFKLIVDYAFEPKAVEQLYHVVGGIAHQKIIHILGSTGGGRDKARRPKLGQLAGTQADFVIVTNEDPYDEDPQVIIDQVAAGALAVGKVLDKNLFKISDRRSAIARAIVLAEPKDIILLTGKGSEQAIVVANNKKIAWDDRRVAREELAKLPQH